VTRRKLLVAGASGVVGGAAMRHVSTLEGWEVVGVSRRVPAGWSHGTVVPIDLSDQRRCADVFGRMTDVTHVVYAAVNEQVGLVQGWRDREQMRLNLAMLRNLLDPLAAAAVHLQHVSLLQGTKAYGAHLGPIVVPARERAPRHPHENFYWLQEDYLRATQIGKAWQWTIWRPQLICGEAIGGNLNVLAAIGVYAALRREAGLPLSYPGGPPFVFEAVDAELLAHALEWAATRPESGNQIFNITNGDVFVWPEIWQSIAAALGMEAGPPAPCRLAQEVPPREAEWAAIVRKYHLRAPAALKEFLGESLAYADFVLGCGLTDTPPPVLVSTIKLRQAGFHECIDTEDMLRKWIARFQQSRLLPPADGARRSA
jgi:nucleoside-diphosphate-sugar epimerase